MQFAQTTQPKKDWSVGLCDCFSDCGECLFAYFCPCCYVYSLFSKADETCCSCLWGGLVPLRTKIRTQRGLEGSICNDYWAVHCCGLCAAVQMGQELKLTNPSI